MASSNGSITAVRNAFTHVSGTLHRIRLEHGKERSAPESLLGRESAKKIDGGFPALFNL